MAPREPLPNPKHPRISANLLQLPLHYQVAESMQSGHKAPEAPDLLRDGGDCKVAEYRAFEGMQLRTQMGARTEPVVWTPHSPNTYSGCHYGQAYDSFQAGPNFEGDTHSQQLTLQKPMEGGTPSWPFPVIGSGMSSAMSLALSDANTELSAPSPESLFSEIGDQSHAYETAFYNSSPIVSWGGSNGTLSATVEPGCGYNLASSHPSGLPHSFYDQEASHLEPPQCQGPYPVQQHHEATDAWGNFNWGNPGPLEMRGSLPWSSTQQGLDHSVSDYDSMVAKQGISESLLENASTLDVPSFSDQVMIKNSDDEVRQNHHNGHGPSRTPLTAKAQREKEDKILLKSKQSGKTYKEICGLLKGTVAESTLRGRYRSLTKEKKDRVRKPVWTPHDIRLLRQAVHAGLNKRGDDRWEKLPWKEIAAFIAENGTYHFGNGTCKKKWQEIHSGQ